MEILENLAWQVSLGEGGGIIEDRGGGNDDALGGAEQARAGFVSLLEDGELMEGAGWGDRKREFFRG